MFNVTYKYLFKYVIYKTLLRIMVIYIFLDTSAYILYEKYKCVWVILFSSKQGVITIKRSLKGILYEKNGTFLLYLFIITIIKK